MEVWTAKMEVALFFFFDELLALMFRVIRIKYTLFYTIVGLKAFGSLLLSPRDVKKSIRPQFSSSCFSNNSSDCFRTVSEWTLCFWTNWSCYRDDHFDVSASLRESRDQLDCSTHQSSVLMHVYKSNGQDGGKSVIFYDTVEHVTRVLCCGHLGKERSCSVPSSLLYTPIKAAKWS